MTVSAKITSKGQVTLPVELRRSLGLKPGDQVDFRRTSEGNYELVARTKSFEDLHGIIEVDGRPPTADDIVDIVHRARIDRAEHIVSRLKDDR
ncbi:MAG: AbrB/MazE/SpoVT family DNA-binding domain-containing protein [Roseitalea sp.]|jgi:AbrB family looped-hinge helix DNA binding protein|uniref:AbrB/MazE/SpoVT family DNA-binding domain-containing protein n=1 Tax=Oceaniradius stylonematis TaxID=2184161 RepID=UPI000F3DD1BF|nr:AbrB/MazE/SpoVT family DNA-binding domain-containing protein [Oceaniradius stylonematis]MBO6551296.1 AbrB/MazE/SpoVT family DNA-binding domain-containing protein [Roseitalea sp.]MBO6952324.1 AbrB/MazE/SpoVT family DNA-binding domain-containing protein [Rhizobiaceae bacterium]RNC90662.1 MAG: AbrB/MazE/SpoVT family DNA-binding domain-containing protein [Oricola sp.]MBO6591830.1 AbrB/MazE/SpoVT family DNA-binding domain-containing protein [Roseitalea sp.]MBO6598085.1 AbrB/MazE/SpoVT family DNA